MNGKAASTLTSIVLPDPVYGERQSYRVRNGVLEWADDTLPWDNWQPWPLEHVGAVIMTRPAVARVLVDVIEDWHRVKARAELAQVGEVLPYAR